MIKSISFANLYPFSGSYKIKLPRGLISIEGRYSDSPDKSNRSGKTAFLDIIRFALFGKVRGARVQSIINRSAVKSRDPIYASVTMIHPETRVEFTVTRKYDPLTGKFVVYVPQLGEMHKKRDIETIIQDELGCDYELSTLTWMSRQDEAKGLMSFDLTKRKTFLLGLMGSKSIPWEAYYAEASARFSTIKARHSIAEENLTALKAQFSTEASMNIEEDKATLNAELSLVLQRKDTASRRLHKLKASSVKAQIIELSSKLQETRKRASTLQTQSIAQQRLLTTISSTIQKRKDLESKLAKLQQTRAKLGKGFDADKLDSLNQRHEELADKIQEFTVKHRAILQDVRRIESFSGVCPVTRLECASGFDVSTHRVALETTAKAIEKTLESLSKEEQEMSGSLDRLNTCADELQSVDMSIAAIEGQLSNLDGGYTVEELEKAEFEYKDLVRDYDRAKAEMLTLDQQLTTLSKTSERKVQDEIIRLEQEISGYIARERSITQSLAELAGRELYLGKLQTDIKALRREVRHSTHRLSVLGALKSALSRDGLPFHSLMAGISEFETHINQALCDLGSDIRVLVEPFRELTTYTKSCMVCGYEFPGASTRCPVCSSARQHKKRETLDILLSGSSYDIDYGEDSGGGQLLVALAVRLALFAAYKERGFLSAVDFFLLDEVFSPLDAYNRQKMTLMLMELLEQYGLSQAFLISHTDMSDVIPPAIIIERDSKTDCSRILV